MEWGLLSQPFHARQVVGRAQSRNQRHRQCIGSLADAESFAPLYRARCVKVEIVHVPREGRGRSLACSSISYGLDEMAVKERIIINQDEQRA
eukprot:5371333-Prymnesium_polylepis.1